MNHFYENIDGWFDFQNVYKMAVESVKESGHFVEVGCWCGKSTSFMGVEIVNSNKNIQFDCVDTWEGSLEHNTYDIVTTNSLYDTFIKNMEPLHGKYNAIRKTSVDAASLYEDNSLDFVFIDASHEYEDIKNDINSWLPKVKTNGILAGHDYSTDWGGVIRGVDEIFGTDIIVMDTRSWVYFKKG